MKKNNRQRINTKRNAATKDRRAKQSRQTKRQTGNTEELTMDYGYEMITMVEMLISGNDSYELPPTDINRPLNIPSQVMDLMYFGRTAGEAFQEIDSGSIASIPMTCPSLSRFAAIVVNRSNWCGLIRKVTALIVNALNTQKIAVHWQDDKTTHKDIIPTIIWCASEDIAKMIPVQIAMSTVLNSLERCDEINPEMASFALDHIKEEYDSWHNKYALAVRDNMINTINATKTFADEWKSQAIDTLLSIDFASTVHLTEENSQIANKLMMSLWEPPQNVAITVGWLASIYRYTEYGPRIKDYLRIKIAPHEVPSHPKAH